MPLINVTIPVWNEAQQLEESVKTLHAFLSEKCRFQFEIVIADNGSTDQSFFIASNLARTFSGVSVMRFDERGRGGAISHVWNSSRADVLTYMDVDLSSDLTYFPILVESLLTGQFDISIGSRLLNPRLTSRGLKRKCISVCLSSLLRVFFHASFYDAQCGFKAITKTSAEKLLPKIKDTHWFWDTELLLLAQAHGLRIFELPIRWVDDPTSTVSLWADMVAHFRGLVRMRFSARSAERIADVSEFQVKNRSRSPRV